MFTDPKDPYFLRWQAIVNFVVFASCISMAMETLEPFATNHQEAFRFAEVIAVAFFTTDYLANLYFAPNRLKYFFSFWGMVDLISIIPSYLFLMNLSALRGAKVFRLLRVIRVLRVLKIARNSLQQMAAKATSGNPIIANLKIYLIALFSVMMISSTLMYFVEGGIYAPEVMTKGQEEMDKRLAADPASKDLPAAEKKFVPEDPISNAPIPEDKQFFTSIPASMWWCIVTLTTTGYGDMYPIGFGGRMIAGVTMLLGLILFGILMNIVGKTLMVLLFGEQIDDKGGPPSQETLVRTMLEMGVINGATYDELLKLSPEELSRRLQGR